MSCGLPGVFRVLNGVRRSQSNISDTWLTSATPIFDFQVVSWEFFFYSTSKSRKLVPSFKNSTAETLGEMHKPTPQITVTSFFQINWVSIKTINVLRNLFW